MWVENKCVFQVSKKEGISNGKKNIVLCQKSHTDFKQNKPIWYEEGIRNISKKQEHQQEKIPLMWLGKKPIENMLKLRKYKLV